MRETRKKQADVTTSLVMCRMPGAEITIERVDHDGYYVHIPLGRGRELYLYGGVDGDLTFDLHNTRGDDSCRLATFDEVVALINGDRAGAAARENSTQSVHKRSARKSRRSK